VINNDAFSNEQLEGFAENGLEGVHSIDQIRNTSISFSYGITDNFSMSGRLPYIERKNIRESEIEDGEAEAHVHGDSSSYGDLLVLTQYKVSSTDETDVSVQRCRCIFCYLNIFYLKNGLFFLQKQLSPTTPLNYQDALFL
jgi:hypothetical protein